jgi:hypothetical protein
MFLSCKKFWRVFLGTITHALDVFETLKAVRLKIQVFWDLVLFLSLNGSRFIEGVSIPAYLRFKHYDLRILSSSLIFVVLQGVLEYFSVLQIIKGFN